MEGKSGFSLALTLLLMVLAGCAHRGPGAVEEPTHVGELVDAVMAPDTFTVDTTRYEDAGDAERAEDAEEAPATDDSEEFDIDGDGAAEEFAWWWDQEADKMRLEVSRTRGGSSRRLLRTSAPTLGYSSAAWFLDESPVRKAVFMTRYGGSSGGGLFYLDLRRKRLELFTDGVFVEGEPQFEDLDGDGQSEIFVPGRGRDRSATWGAALYRWDGARYGLWWPDWNGVPYVIYGRLQDVDGDARPEIVAVLEDEPYSDEIDQLKGARKLGLWSVADGVPRLVASVRLPDAEYIGEPEIADTSRVDGRGLIRLSYEAREVVCTYRDHGLTCSEPGSR